MSIIGTTHGKLLVMMLSVAIVAAFGGSLAYAQTTQSLSQTSLIQGQGFQMNYGAMFSIGHGGVGPIGMCHGNMSYSQTPGNTIPSSTTGQSQT